jgi:hypothetical protein|tara:strand:- start:1043 stop:1198 length:156 start_codon:yes stop_codon:yes gene_type:complete
MKNKNINTTKFGVIGKRTMKEIQKEISYLKEFDKLTSDKVRATYSIGIKKV